MASCLDGRGELGNHVFDGDHALSRKMAALLGRVLIFELHAGQSDPFKLPDGFPDHRRRSVPRVCIDQCRDRHAVRDHGCIGRHLRQRDHPGIRQATRGRNGRSRHIERAEPGPLNLQGRQRVEGSGHGDGAGRQQFPQALSFADGRALSRHVVTLRSGITVPMSVTCSKFQTVSMRRASRVPPMRLDARRRNLSSTC